MYARRAADGVGVAREIAVDVVGVDLLIAERVADPRDPPLPVAGERDPGAGGVRDPAGAEREAVALRVGDALQTRDLVDHELVAARGRVLEALRVDRIQRAVVEHLARARDPTGVEDGRPVERRQRAAGARQRLVGQVRERDRDDRLALRRDHRLEPLRRPARQRDRQHVRLRRHDAVLREDDAGARLLPALAVDAARARPQRLDAERPADAEVADPLVAAVVRARDLDRDPGDRHRQVEERDGEVADLLVAHDRHRPLDGRRAARAVGDGQTQRVLVVHQDGRVERAETRRGDVRRARARAR